MNARLQALANQAGFQYIKDEGIGWAGNYNASLPKFAQLIVRECTKLIEQSIEDDEYLSRTTGAESIMAIEEHFGVEE